MDALNAIKVFWALVVVGMIEQVGCKLSDLLSKEPRRPCSKIDLLFAVVFQCSLYRRLVGPNILLTGPRSNSRPFQAFGLDASTESIHPKTEVAANTLCKIDHLVLICGRHREHSRRSRDV